MKTVKENSTVDVDYEGRLEDGKLFDTSKENIAKEEGIYSEERPYEPLHVTLGEGMLIKGFENALIDMGEGEEKTVKIKSEEAYGERREELVQKFKKDAERDKELKIGTALMVNVQGQEIPGIVVEVSDDIVVDFNHPLAGQDLTFKLKVVKIE
ncbi:peptidylprolyl isomerase [Candidatus Woesearchaeota archaeon]|nr:peptidylprolyl isomerase [Candidatus Woesearchaeota archaeon]